MTSDHPILGEQLAYYRARAREYDKWFRREGLHDLGEEHNARWRLELNRLYSALDAFAPRGDVLELAYGTGEWTIRLAESATRVVGVDAAPEMRELALAKSQDAGKSNVELCVGDRSGALDLGQDARDAQGSRRAGSWNRSDPGPGRPELRVKS